MSLNCVLTALKTEGWPVLIWLMLTWKTAHRELLLYEQISLLRRKICKCFQVLAVWSSIVEHLQLCSSQFTPPMTFNLLAGWCRLVLQHNNNSTFAPASCTKCLSAWTCACCSRECICLCQTSIICTLQCWCVMRPLPVTLASVKVKTGSQVYLWGE